MATISIETPRGITIEVDPEADAQKRLAESLIAVASARRALIKRGSNPDTGRLIHEGQLTLRELESD